MAKNSEPVTLPDFRVLRGEKFEMALRLEVAMANMRVKGSGPAPWEVVMEAVIALEKKLEQHRGR